MITNKSYYGLVALAHLAVSGRDRHIGVKEIAISKSLPQRFLELLFARLRAMEILVSTRGATGGYQLARSPSEISLKEIILACEGLKDLALPDTTSGRMSGTEAVAKTLTGIINKQMALLEQSLETIKLSDVIEQSGETADMYWI